MFLIISSQSDAFYISLKFREWMKYTFFFIFSPLLHNSHFNLLPKASTWCTQRKLFFLCITTILNFQLKLYSHSSHWNAPLFLLIWIYFKFSFANHSTHPTLRHDEPFLCHFLWWRCAETDGHSIIFTYQSEFEIRKWNGYSALCVPVEEKKEKVY